MQGICLDGGQTPPASPQAAPPPPLAGEAMGCVLSSQKTLDSKQGRAYTKCTKSSGSDPSLLVPPVQKRAKKVNMARMNDPREAAHGGAEGEGKNSQAKGSDQDGTSESARQRRCTPKGQLIVSGISQVTTEAEGPKGSFCLLFFAKKQSKHAGDRRSPLQKHTEEKHERTETHPTL